MTSSPGRILVADDEPGVRSFLAEALELDGHHVVQATNGRDALQKLEAETVQVVVTDLKMPELDGLGLLRSLRVQQPEIEIIIITAHGSVDNAVEAMKLGAFDFLQKPISGPSEIRLLVERALERHRLRSFREATKGDGGPPLSHGAASMQPVIRALEKVAPTDANLLLLGESGTGKEVAARAVHSASSRRDGPFIAVNCAALSAELLESELFGHEKGAFTGAAERRRGKIELAASGTFFLDEIGELAPALQAKLLRVLQERTFERVGGNTTIHADVRWIAATNRDLQAMVESGGFRSDLFHRLAVFPVALPPLRERREDLPQLAAHLLERSCRALGRPPLKLDDEAIATLQARSWPGNIRELGNCLERAAILADDEYVRAEDVDDLFFARGTPKREPSTPDDSGAARTLADLEREAIMQALDRNDGNRKRAAEDLGIGTRTLYDKLKRYAEE